MTRYRILDQVTLELNEKWYTVQFLEKDTSLDHDYVKWHNFIMENQTDHHEFYVLQIVQPVHGKPSFWCEYFTNRDGAGNVLGEWDYLEKCFYPEDAEKLKKLLIELSDKELEISFKKEVGG